METTKKKFLLIRFSSIGDIVLTTPIIRCLKQQYNGAEIHYATKKEYVPLLASNPYIDKIHPLEEDLNKLCDKIKQEGIDYIIDLHKNIRSFYLKSKLRKLSFAFDKLNIEKWLLVNLKVNRLPGKHIVDRYFDLLKPFKIYNDQKGIDYFIPDEDEVKLNDFPREFRKGYVAFCIGAKHYTKQLTSRKIIEICDQLEMPIIMLGGKDDYQKAKRIKINVGKQAFNACGMYNINQSASLLKQACLVITHDTGLMHIASAFKQSIISIWGNTVPEFGMYPYMPDDYSRIIEVKNLSCRPCSKLGFEKCPKNHFKCIENINEETIVRYTQELFQLNRKK